MRPQLKVLCEYSGIKTKKIFVDEHKRIGWTEIICTDIELENFVQLILKNQELIKEWDINYNE